MAILNSLPSSEPRLIDGVVVSKGTYQGMDSGGDKLGIETETGKIITISVLDQVGIRIGDRVKLNTYDRYVFGAKYQLMTVVKE